MVFLRQWKNQEKIEFDFIKPKPCTNNEFYR